jgi:hypothetical protein
LLIGRPFYRAIVRKGARVMFNTIWSISAWLLAAGLAFALAFASPTESRVMGEIMPVVSRTLTEQPVSVPYDLPQNRTLALVTFKRSQSEQAESWIQGLNLRGDPSIAWLRMPVIHDPGTVQGREEVKARLLGYYPGTDERARFVPVFVDRSSFTRAAGLSDTDRAYALVLNRQGDVLARVEGAYSASKARALRETLLAAGP